MKITDEMLYASASKARDLWLSSAFPNDIPEHQFSHRFNRIMKRLMKEQRRPPRLNHVIHMMRRTAAILLVVTAVSFSCLMTVDAMSLLITVSSRKYPAYRVKPNLE